MQVRVKTDYRGFSFHFIAATACLPFNPRNICSVLGFFGLSVSWIIWGFLKSLWPSCMCWAICWNTSIQLLAISGIASKKLLSTSKKRWVDLSKCLTYCSSCISICPFLSLSSFSKAVFSSLFSLCCFFSAPLCIHLSSPPPPHANILLSLLPSLQVLRIMVAFLRLVVLTSARAQTAWCDAATEGCTLCPRAFPRTPLSCETGLLAL